METKLIPHNILLLLTLFLISSLAYAQQGKEVIPCKKYKDFINSSENIVEDNYKGSALLSYNLPEDVMLTNTVSDETMKELESMARCEIENFITSSVRTKRMREQLRLNQVVVKQESFTTNDNITLGIIKIVLGSSEKLYANSVILKEGQTLHNYTDFGEQDFDIRLFGAEKVDEHYKLYAEETENKGSLYFGKFCIVFRGNKRISTFELHKKS
jgi:hypothetical protein